MNINIRTEGYGYGGLKSMRCPFPELLDILRQQVISICEGSVPYWGPMITVAVINMLERYLKTGLLFGTVVPSTG